MRQSDLQFYFQWKDFNLKLLNICLLTTSHSLCMWTNPYLSEEVLIIDISDSEIDKIIVFTIS